MVRFSAPSPSQPQAVARAATRLVWLLFAAALAALVLSMSGMVPGPDTTLAAGPFLIDRLALFLAVAATLVSGVVHSFSRRYMDGDRYQGRFFAGLSALTLLVLLLLASDHLAMFALVWTMMGVMLARLIGHSGMAAADAAESLARRSFLAGSVAMAVGMVLLWQATGATRISSLPPLLAGGAGDAGLLRLATLAFTLAAVIQCGLIPAHRWLMSSMTAPTPVSAFMHAGLVNAGGILLARTAPVFDAVPGALALVFAAGAASMLVGAAIAQVQPDVKRGLAASTTAQMGFMIVQCGLGFHAAAMAHLMLHGLYKASLFLGAGSALSARRPAAAAAGMGIDLGAVVPAVLAGLAAAAGFAAVTGKLDPTLAGQPDSGAVLVVIAGLAGAQLAFAARHQVMTGHGGAEGMTGRALGAIILAVLTGCCGLAYGLVMTGVEGLLTVNIAAAVDATAATGLTVAPPLTLAPPLVLAQPLSLVHLALPVLLVVAWIGLAISRNRGNPRLYALLLTAGQPASATVTRSPVTRSPVTRSYATRSIATGAAAADRHAAYQRIGDHA